MHGCVHEGQRRPLRTESGDRFLAPVGRAVVRDPEDAPRGAIGLGGHHLLDKPVDRANGRLGFAPAKEFGVMYIPCGEVRQRARPEVLVFNAHRASRAWRQRRMLAAARLETRFFIGRDDVFIGPQRGPVPGSGIQIQHAPGFLGELRVSRKDPAPMTPGLQRIGAQPTPQGDAADLGHDATGEDLAMQFGNGETRQRHIAVTGQLAREPLNVDDDAGGKSGLRARLEVPPRGRPRVLSKKRWRHLLTIWRGISSRAAITSLRKPSAASKTILARMTSRYGDVYLRARASSAARSSAVSSMTYGLCLGVGAPPCPPRKVSDRAALPPQ